MNRNSLFVGRVQFCYASSMSKTKIQMKLESIGIVRSDFKERFVTTRQGHLCPESRGEIVFHKHLQPQFLLEGLDSFSHVWLLWWCHLNPRFKLKPKIRPPRMNGKRMGLISTRSPLRPNPIGLSLVKIESTVKGRLLVSGLALVDQTPIIDIKPYTSADRADHFHWGWDN